MSAEEKYVLIVEDDKTLVELYKVFLRLMGIENILYAENVKECIEILENKKPVLTFLDLGLEDLDPPPGFNILKDYKDKTKIIILSGYHKHEQRCIAEGAVAFLGKPVGTEKILELIKEYS